MYFSSTLLYVFCKSLFIFVLLRLASQRSTPRIKRLAPRLQDSLCAQAVFGGKVEVPTLDGKIEIQIPKGVQHGQLEVLRGKGLPTHGFFVNHGDQYVRFRIKFPTTINDRQRAILEEFEKEELVRADSTSNEEKWWQPILEHLRDPHSLPKLAMVIMLLLLLIVG